MNNDVKYHAYFQQGPIPGNNLVPEAGQKYEDRDKILIPYLRNQN